MNIKPKSNRSMNRLTPGQKEKVDEWLFDGNVTYTEAMKRCEEAFGVTLTKSSVARHYQRERALRCMDLYGHSKNPSY